MVVAVPEGVPLGCRSRSSTWPPKSTDVREALFARRTLYRRIALYTAAVRYSPSTPARVVGPLYSLAALLSLRLAKAPFFFVNVGLAAAGCRTASAASRTARVVLSFFK